MTSTADELLRDALAEAMCKHDYLADWFERADAVLETLGLHVLGLSDRTKREIFGDDVPLPLFVATALSDRRPPAVVGRNVDSGEANEIYGDRFGVDWVYAPG